MNLLCCPERNGCWRVAMATKELGMSMGIATRAVIRVGDGRGFIVSAGESRYVITAAHCLPLDRLPTPHLANSASELTFPKIMGRKRLTIWGELCSFSLTDDFAVLCEPDVECGEDHYIRFETFTKRAMPVGLSPDTVDPHLSKERPGQIAWTMSLAGDWQKCTVYNGGRFLTLDTGAKIESGMSGSPIVNDKGAAIGVISTGNSGVGSNLNPSLTDCLPPWLLRKLDIFSDVKS
jgi:hypothetical protein